MRFATSAVSSRAWAGVLVSFCDNDDLEGMIVLFTMQDLSFDVVDPDAKD